MERMCQGPALAAPLRLGVLGCVFFILSCVLFFGFSLQRALSTRTAADGTHLQGFSPISWGFKMLPPGHQCMIVFFASVVVCLTGRLVSILLQDSELTLFPFPPEVVSSLRVERFWFLGICASSLLRPARNGIGFCCPVFFLQWSVLCSFCSVLCHCSVGCQAELTEPTVKTGESSECVALRQGPAGVRLT